MHRPKLAIEMLCPRRGATGYFGGGERPEAAIEARFWMMSRPQLSGRRPLDLGPDIDLCLALGKVVTVDRFPIASVLW
jgi:hypothetical protein